MSWAAPAGPHHLFACLCPPRIGPPQPPQGRYASLRDGLRPPMPPEPSGSAPAGYRLRLAVAAAARDGDQDATATLVRQAHAHGLDVAELLAVAEAHWPKPALHRRAFRAGRSWMTTRLRHRPRRPSAFVIPRKGRL